MKWAINKLSEVQKRQQVPASDESRAPARTGLGKEQEMAQQNLPVQRKCIKQTKVSFSRVYLAM